MKYKILLLSILISATIITLSLINFNKNQYRIPQNIKYHTLSKNTQKQIDCLADNIYYEAGKETHDGKIAVALVTINRVNSGKYPNNICDVVKQKIDGICQFSWMCDEARKTILSHTPHYIEIRQIAIDTYMNYENMNDITYGATYFHSNSINPKWKLQKTIIIGNHTFYKK
jgi:N-acetylmuramoyl-L-alanine amidase